MFAAQKLNDELLPMSQNGRLRSEDYRFGKSLIRDSHFRLVALKLAYRL